MRKVAMITSALLLSTSGCNSPQRAPMSMSDLGINVRTYVSIVDPLSGNPMNWSELMDRVSESTVILLGEQHDHSVGHAVQLEIVMDVLDRYPQSVVALEMLERDEQILVDDYADEIIDSEKFAALTGSASSWGGKDGWSSWYQPVIDAAIKTGGGVVAANAPKRYLKLARVHGYKKIDELPKNRKRLLDYPSELSGGRYRQRFWEWASHGDSENEGVEIDVTTIDKDDPMLPWYRSQQVWDATMAESLARVRPTLNKKVLLLVGQFHVEYEGGIVQELKRRLPIAKVLTISIQRTFPIQTEDWQGAPPIADIMIVGEDPGR